MIVRFRDTAGDAAIPRIAIPSLGEDGPEVANRRVYHQSGAMTIVRMTYATCILVLLCVTVDVMSRVEYNCKEHGAFHAKATKLLLLLGSVLPSSAVCSALPVEAPLT